MTKKKSLLHVRSHLEWINDYLGYLIEDNERLEKATRLAPIYLDEAKKIRFITQAILRKHKTKKTRKQREYTIKERENA